jgi:hypothetical protein
MSEDMVRGALVAARDYLRRCANPEVTYGYFPGGDPRDFTPDEESCRPDEIARWKEACAAWERGEKPDPGGPHIPLEGGCGHITMAYYGIGTYSIRDADAEDVLDQIDAALAALTGSTE